MSYSDLYLGGSPLITSSGEGKKAATVFGVPFDSTHSYRPGCRFGPEAIRDAFNNIEAFHPKLGVDLETTRIDDLGNVIHTVVARQMADMVTKITKEHAAGGVPLFVLGGEHSITYATFTALDPGTGFVVFDAHYDLRDGYEGAELSHAAYLRRIAEERGAENILHVGARAFAAEELEFLQENNIKTVSDAQVRAGRGPEIIRDFASSFNSIYASVDIDVLDPAFAPGVGNPEAAGMSSRELLDLVGALADARIAGADIVEVNPHFDNGSTAAVAAKILSSMIAMGAARLG